MITINVTADDIARGVPGCGTCPIANALRHYADVPWIVGEAREIISESTDGLRTWQGSPLAVVDDFIEAFDHGRDVKPFSFVLVPQASDDDETDSYDEECFRKGV